MAMHLKVQYPAEVVPPATEGRSFGGHNYRFMDQSSIFLWGLVPIRFRNKTTFEILGFVVEKGSIP